MKDIGEKNAEARFDQIRRANVQEFLKLLEAMEGHHGTLITTLQRMCRYQISGIMHAIGTREL